MGQLQKHWSWLQQLLGRGPTVADVVKREMEHLEFRYMELRLRMIDDEYESMAIKAKHRFLNSCQCDGSIPE